MRVQGTRTRRRAAGVAITLALAGLTSCTSTDGGPAAAEGSAATTPATTAVPTTVPTTAPASAATVARAFLAEWSAGNLDGAAGLTDQPDAARAALTSLGLLPVTAVQASLGAAAPDAVGFPFALTLTVGGNGYGGTFAYDSSLALARAEAGWKVKWSPAVIHPRLTATTKLQIGAAPSPNPPGSSPGTAVDRNGQPLASTSYPSLTNALSLLGAGTSAEQLVPVIQLAPQSGGMPSTLGAIVPAGGAEPRQATGRATTIDAAVQGAAERAVRSSFLPTGLVVLQASTGQILAMASKGPADGHHVGKRVPGSTMKVLVASALLRNGLSPGSPVPCPEFAHPPGRQPVENDSKSETNPSATLEYDLAVSCNTAFVNEGMKLPRDTVSNEARRSYGLNAAWDIGLGDPIQYASIPVPTSTDDHAEAMFGQGAGQTMSPLALASVAATVASGQFRQPVFVPDAKNLVTAAPLSANVADGLRRMMRAVVNSGTATTLKGFGNVGAKTGTAQVGGGNVGWMMAFRGDLAFAVDVVGISASASGNATAGAVLAGLLGSPELTGR